MQTLIILLIAILIVIAYELWQLIRIFKSSPFMNLYSQSINTPEYDHDELDEMYDEAESLVRESGKATASLIQRRLSIGYARAARILDQLESQGVVGPAHGSKPRDVVSKSEE